MRWRVRRGSGASRIASNEVLASAGMLVHGADTVPCDLVTITIGFQYSTESDILLGSGLTMPCFYDIVRTRVRGISPTINVSSVLTATWDRTEA